MHTWRHGPNASAIGGFNGGIDDPILSLPRNAPGEYSTGDRSDSSFGLRPTPTKDAPVSSAPKPDGAISARKLFKFSSYALLMGFASLALSLIYHASGLHMPMAKDIPVRQGGTAVHGIGLAGVTYTKEIAYGLGTVLTIHGTIINSADKELAVPGVLQVTLSDAGMKTLFTTQIKPDVRRLGPGQRLPFQTQIYDTPNAAVHLQLRLLN